MEKRKKKVAILSGAGISAESGLGTFRDSGGLWEQYDIHDVATIEAWHKDPELVLSFYDARRAQVLKTSPNKAHFALAELEPHFDTTIITQNIDDLHERAGSSNIIHLHGEILKGRSVNSDTELFAIESTIKLDDKTPNGEQMRPHVVWFGEPVPKLSEAEKIIQDTDILIIIGTSLNVYPAAALRFAAKDEVEKYIIDTNDISITDQDFKHLKGTATEQTPSLVAALINSLAN